MIGGDGGRAGYVGNPVTRAAIEAIRAEGRSAGYRAGFIAGGSLATRMALAVIGALVGGLLDGEATIDLSDLRADWTVERSETPHGLRYTARKTERRGGEADGN